MSVALVRRSECVPKNLGSNPILAIHPDTSRAYCRVCHAPIAVTTACEQELAGLLTGGLDVLIDRLPGLFGQLEPDGMSGFPLADGGTINGDPVRSHILNLEADDIAASELTVDGKIEHGKIACSALDLQLGPDRPDMLRSQRRFGAEQLALVPRDMD